MAWVKVESQKIVGMKKFFDFRTELKWDQFKGLGFLSYLWDKTADVQEDGDVTDWNAEYFAFVLNLPLEEATAIWNALLGRWIDIYPDGRMLMHEWIEWIGPRLISKYKNRKGPKTPEFPKGSPPPKLIHIWKIYGLDYGKIIKDNEEKSDPPKNPKGLPKESLGIPEGFPEPLNENKTENNEYNDEFRESLGIPTGSFRETPEKRREEKSIITPPTPMGGGSLELPAPTAPPSLGVVKPNPIPPTPVGYVQFCTVIQESYEKKFKDEKCPFFPLRRAEEILLKQKMIAMGTENIELMWRFYIDDRFRWGYIDQDREHQLPPITIQNFLTRLVRIQQHKDWRKFKEKYVLSLVGNQNQKINDN